MDEIMSKLSEVLNDPESMKQITKLASMFSGTEQTSQQNEDSRQESDSSQGVNAMLSSLLSSAEGQRKTPVPESPEQSAAPDIAKLMQIGNMLGASAAGDKNVALLMALRPLLKDENQIKIDRLVKIFRLLAAYPLIRDSGLLGGDLFG